MLQVKIIQNKKIWTTFLDKHYKGFFPFFQSWNWGEVQRRLGFPVQRIGLYEDNKLCGVAMLVEIRAKRGVYIHLRHGPVLNQFVKSHFSVMMRYVKKYAKEKEASFIRISPLIPLQQKSENILENYGFRNAPVHNMDGEICWVLDISQSSEQLLANMRKSHRYLIRKSLTQPLHIIKADKIDKTILEFLGIYNTLASKRGFVPHKGLVEELEVLGKDKEAVLFLAEYEGKIIGGALIDFVGPMAIYHHGATDDAYRDLAVSYRLQWEAILEAKKRGKTVYNFWGISPSESKKHPWFGLTLFKTGFGGEKREFIHAKDLPLGIAYWKTWLIEMIFKIRRGY